MPIQRNEYNEKSKGGTELSIAELESRLDPELLSKVQVIPSRFRGLQEGLVPIYWVHDTADDPEMNHLANGGWKKFKRIAFVSNWQMQTFISRFNIPWSHCEVLPNAAVPFPEPKPLEGPISFVYHTTPHRGLDVLVAAFDALAQDHDAHLHVYSSFSIYGWADMDKPYEKLFDRIKAHPRMTYHGAQDNDVIRAALSKSHAFVYPSTWPETGCRALIEAMMAGCVCATTNFGCLYETAGDTAYVYQMHEDKQQLAQKTYGVMKSVLNEYETRGAGINDMRRVNAKRATSRFSWDRRAIEWNDFLRRNLA